MSAQELVRDLTWLVYLLIFLYVARQALREPRRATIDSALFFALSALVIVDSFLAELGLLMQSVVLDAINGTLIMCLAYVLLRLVDDFAQVPAYLLWLAGVVLAFLCLGLFVFVPPRPVWLTLLQVAYFVGLQLYAAFAFVRASRRSGGVTRRRMMAVAVGSGLLGVNILAASVQSVQAEFATVSLLCGLVSGICYFLGFATPRFLRRAWQEPELRAFLGQAATLPRLPSTAEIIQALERGAAASMGAHRAAIGLWNAETDTLHFEIGGTVVNAPLTEERPTGRSFLLQESIFIADVPRTLPALAEQSRAFGSKSLLVAPISAGDKRLGVLAVYASRTPIFARDDLALVKLLADQAAVILESRSLIDEAGRVQAREEAARLKDDFLSAAAHDLKTPLTTLVARAQLLERRALRTPDAPADLASIRAVISETQRLRDFVLELLDATRVERGLLVGQREDVDLRALIEETVQRRAGAPEQFTLDLHESVIGSYDRNRICQLLENLIENAAKYNLENESVEIKLWQQDHTAHVTVADHGIGIPANDVPHIFDRFFRGTNVDDRRFAGLGLGLYICRGIVEQHGGHIWATSRVGVGTTMHISLPTGADGGRNA